MSFKEEYKNLTPAPAELELHLQSLGMNLTHLNKHTNHEGYHENLRNI